MQGDTESQATSVGRHSLLDSAIRSVQGRLKLRRRKTRKESRDNITNRRSSDEARSVNTITVAKDKSGAIERDREVSPTPGPSVPPYATAPGQSQFPDHLASGFNYNTAYSEDTRRTDEENYGGGDGNDVYSTVSSTASNMFSEPPMPQSNVVSVVVGAFVAVAGFLFGYDTGLINSISEMPYVLTHMTHSKKSFSTPERAILVSFLALGTFFGALSAPVMADKWGRKPPIVVSSLIIFSVGNSLQVASKKLPLLTVGRVISGYGLGVMSAVVPLYQAETVSRYLRGSIISMYQWAITWGLLVSSAVAIGTKNMDNASSYRIPIGLQFIWNTILGIGVLFLPESPRFYVLKDDLTSAAKSLSFLRGVPVHDSGLLEELVEIKATYDYEASVESSSILDCFRTTEKRPKQTLRMFTGMAIQAFQQFSGINFIFYYGVNFFASTGVQNSYVISLTTYAVNVVFNVPGLFFVEYYGRRRILLCGGVIMTISNLIIGIVGASLNTVVADKVMIAFICVFIAAFSATWGGVVWVVSAELYPLGIRSKCSAICAATNWLVNFICALITPYIVNVKDHTSSIGARIFFIWGGLNAMGVIAVYFMVYETKGLVLEDIDELYKKAENARSSVYWNNKILEEELRGLNHSGIDLQNALDGSKIIAGDNQGIIASDNRNFTGNSATEGPSSGCSATVAAGPGTPRNNNNYLTIDNGKENYELKLYSSFNSSGLNDSSIPNSSLRRNDNSAFNEYMMQEHGGGTAIARDNLSDHLPNVNHLLYSANQDGNNYLDLGNGLGLNPYSRGPPSISPESSDNEQDTSIGGGGTAGDRQSGSLHYSEDRQQMDKINDYMAQIMYNDANSGSARSALSARSTRSHGANITSAFAGIGSSNEPVSPHGNSDFIDLGGGMNLNVISRGPPDILSDSSDEEYQQELESSREPTPPDEQHPHNFTLQ